MQNQLESLKTQLQSPQLEVALEALSSLEGMEASRQTNQILIDALSHRVWRARKLIADALKRRIRQAFPQLAESLRHSSAHIRYWSIQVLPAAGDDAVTILTDNYELMPQEDQIFILRALAKIRSPRAIPFAVKELSSEQYSIRREASQILKELGSSAVPALKELLRTGSDHQRFWAFRLIGMSVGSKALPTFRTILFSQDYDEKIKSYALSGLKEVHSEETVPILLEVLDSDLWALRAQASKILVQHPSECTLGLLKSLKEKNKARRYWLTQILLERIDAKYLGHLEELFKNADAELRYQTLNLIAKLGSEDSSRVLARAFTDSIWYIRKQAADLLVQMGPVCIHPLSDMVPHADEESLFWICRVLGRLGRPSGLKTLESLLDHKTKEIRLHALEAIASVPEDQAVHLLIKAFRNEFWIVRAKASEYLQKRLEQASIPLLSHLHSSDESLAYWVSRTIDDCSLPGLQAMMGIFGELSPSEARTVCEHLSRLRPEILSDLLSRFGLKRLHVLEKLQSIHNLNSASLIGNRILNDTPFHPLERSDFRHEQEVRFQEILGEFAAMGAATLQLRIGSPPMARVNGVLCKCTNHLLGTLDIQEFLLPHLDGDRLKELAERGRLEFSLPWAEGLHFRIHMTRHNQGHEAVIHRMRSTVPGFEELHLPVDFLQSVARLPRGLVLVSGPACSGKSLLILSLLAYINRHTSRSILTFEDEIEHPLEPHKSVISQRRYGAAFHSWEDIMPTLAREDADVLYMARTPDFPSAETLLHLATSRTLIFLESSASSTRDAFDKMMAAFPPAQAGIYCKLLQKSLAASIHIRLVHTADESGMTPALEYFISNSSLASRLTPQGLEDLQKILMESEGSETTVSLDEYLLGLASNGRITYQEAVRYMEDKSKVSISQIW